MHCQTSLVPSTDPGNPVLHNIDDFQSLCLCVRDEVVPPSLLESRRGSGENRQADYGNIRLSSDYPTSPQGFRVIREPRSEALTWRAVEVKCQAFIKTQGCEYPTEESSHALQAFHVFSHPCSSQTPQPSFWHGRSRWQLAPGRSTSCATTTKDTIFPKTTHTGSPHTSLYKLCDVRRLCAHLPPQTTLPVLSYTNSILPCTMNKDIWACVIQRISFQQQTGKWL